MPHITEELWSLLRLGGGSIQFAAPPQKISLDTLADVSGKRRLVSAIYQTVQAGRNIRAEANIPSNRKIRFILRTNNKSLSNQIPTLTRLLNAQEVELDPNYQAQAGNPVAITPLGEIFLAIDTADKARERERLDKEIAKIEDDLRTVEAKLQNSSFVDRAPADVVEEHRRRLADFTAQLAKLRQARAGLK
jgi:valyl-tRNA synthetase